MQFREYTAKHAERNGKIDGRGWRFTIMPWFVDHFDPVPNADCEFPPFVEGLNRAAAAEIEQTRTQWEADSGRLSEQGASLVVRIAAAHKQQAQQTSTRLLDEYVRCRERRETAWGVATANSDKIVEDYRALCGHYKQGNLRGRKSGGERVKTWQPPAVGIPREFRALVPLRDALGYSEEQYLEMGIPVGGDTSEPEETP